MCINAIFVSSVQSSSGTDHYGLLTREPSCVFTRQSGESGKGGVEPARSMR
jgi:hypothetical protein